MITGILCEKCEEVLMKTRLGNSYKKASLSSEALEQVELIINF
jgi:hypothetical protein